MNYDKIKVSRYNLGKSKMCSGNKYRVRMGYKGAYISFYFHDNYKNESGLKDYLYALLNDKHAYEYTYGVDDFASEFGYENRKEAKRIREACKRNADKLNRLFTTEELEKIEEDLSDY